MNDYSWVDRSEYPFKSHDLQVEGGQMHYVDEGQGRPLVMVHGAPTWSFLYRYLIKGLSDEYRVIAPDHIGFGLSEKPENWTYLPQDHTRNLEALIEHLGLKDIVLVVHDFGGPIGLSYALDHPENVSALVVFDTFLWSLQGDPEFERSNRLLNNAFGRWLFLKQNFSARMLVRSGWGKHRPLTQARYRQYTAPFPDAASRWGDWRFFQSLLGESAWFESLWEKRDCIADKPALLLWGMRDIFFKEKELVRWKTLFPQARAVMYPQVGHFVPDEAGPETLEEVRAFLHATFP